MSYAGQDPGNLTPDQMYGDGPESADEMNGTECGLDQDEDTPPAFRDHAEEIAWYQARFRRRNEDCCPLCGSGDVIPAAIEYTIRCASCGVVHLARAS